MPARTSQRSTSDRALEEFSVRLSHWLSDALWRYRSELALLILAVVGLAAAVFAAPGLIVIVAVVYLALWVGLRRPIFRMLERARVRRRFEAAASHCGLDNVNVRTVTLSEQGAWLALSLARGQTFSEFERQAESLASAMGVREMRVERSYDDASKGSVLVVSGAQRPREPEPWPGHRGRITQPFPVGTTEAGGAVQLDMFHRHCLVAGQTGFGKTSLLGGVIEVGIGDPQCRVLLVDVAKRGAGLGKWEHYADRLAVTRADAVAMLEAVKTEMDNCWDGLRRRGRWETTRDDPTTLLVIDEIAPLTLGKDGKAASSLLWQLLSVGRAAGLNVVVACQKPHSAVLDTNLRDLFSHRFAFRASTPDMGTTITGYPYEMRPQDYPVGTALMITDDGLPRRIRTYDALRAAA